VLDVRFAVDIGYLGRREGNNLVLGIVFEEDVEIMEISSSCTHYQSSFYHHVPLENSESLVLKV